MRVIFIFLIALIATSVANAQQKFNKPVRSSLTLTAHHVKGKFRLEQLSTATNALLRRTPPALMLPTDSTAHLTWVTNISEPVIINLLLMSGSATASQKVYLQPGDSLSLVFNNQDTTDHDIMMDTLRSKAGALNNALAWYEFTNSIFAKVMWDRFETKQASLSFMQQQLKTMDSIYAKAQQIAGNNNYLQAMHAFNMINTRNYCWWYCDENKMTGAIPASLAAPAYDDKAFGLFNQPVFIKHILPGEVKGGFFFLYDWMLKQRFKKERATMTNDSTKMAFIGKKALGLSTYAPFRELVQYWYIKDVYFPYLQQSHSVSELAVARKLAATAAAPVKDTALQNRLQQLIVTMGNVLPGTPGLNFALEDHKGKIWHFGDLKGKVVYIDVWTTWCGPCREEAPLFEKMAADYAGKDIVFLGISADRPKDKATWIEMAGHKQTLQLYSGEKTAFMQYYQVPGYPTFLLFDKEGKVVNANAPRPSSEKLLKDVINKLL
ncbi:TlpA family protein disulfide reductase [Chitinophaga sp. 22321]|uniref:TlpA family protein disulfide reductase n=1 Tax=Chitinophaga hostae TaxID=2831022 RepID=A0ABS5IV17_9BACT|nr:TlpA disulfide reductase family protein [Chitinophaga hostae]MBS0026067.1 TlpA family protein disulfide reductase [Chitinophaga hostae]